MAEFEERLSSYTEEIDEIIMGFLPEDGAGAEVLSEAMNYSVCGGGKRLRPLILRQVFRSMGGKTAAERMLVEPFMAAIEYIHSYSLVHDDLPEMDNDELRRGKPTAHVKYGQAMAVLAGDALLNYAYETVAEAVSAAALSGKADAAVAAAEAFSVLASKAGYLGMVGGQSVDVLSTGKKIDRLTLDYIYRNKTSALIEAAFVIGAVLAGADRDKIDSLEEAAGKLGMAFQIRDDILDATSATEVIGKDAHSDEANNKSTFVTLYGLEKANEECERLCNEAREVIAGLTGENSFLVQLCSYLANRNK